MAAKINIPTINGVTLNTKNKYVEDDIVITVGIPHYDGSASEDVTPDIDGLINGTITEISNDRVESIRARAFYQYEVLESVSFKNVKIININAFYGCTKLESIDFPNVTNVKALAFAYCSSFTKVSMPNVTWVEDQCFRNCTAIETFYLPNLKTATGGAFAYCTSIKAIIIEQTDSVVTIGATNCFNGSSIANGTGFVYVPDSLVDSYKSATNWSTYADQIKPLSEYVEE